MDYHDRFAVEREARRLRSEEIGRLEAAAIDWMRTRLHGLRARLATLFRLPRSA
jgi:hypothetical protein